MRTGATHLSLDLRRGCDGAFTYRVSGPSGAASPADRPIAYLSWFSAARFANWMANGQPRGAQDESTTEDGAYPLLGRTNGASVAKRDVNPHPGAAPTFYVPTENEWYKAAYYRPEGLGAAGHYFAVATQSDAAPGNQLGDAANQANYITDSIGYSIYSVTQAAALDLSQNYLSEVGAFSASASHYGPARENNDVGFRLAVAP